MPKAVPLAAARIIELENIQNVRKVDITSLADSLTFAAERYVQLIYEEAKKADAVSSGKMLANTKPTSVNIAGNIFSIGVETPFYTKFVDEGVNGWARSRGSKYSFKTKGVDPNGAMVASIKDWLSREGSASRNTKGYSGREVKGRQILDAKTQRAVTTAYMIKRFGIKPKHFWQAATNRMELIIKDEFGAALKINIINNLG